MGAKDDLRTSLTYAFDGLHKEGVGLSNSDMIDESSIPFLFEEEYHNGRYD